MALPLPALRSIRHKFVLLTAVPVSLLFILLETFVTRMELRRTEKELQTEMLLDAQSTAVGIRGEFQAASKLATFNADVIANLQPASSQSVELLTRAALQSNPAVFGAAIAWEPGAFDSTHHLYSPYSYRSEQGIQLIDIGDPDPTIGYNYLDEPWYAAPKASHEASWSPPYYDDGAGNVLMTTFSVPFSREGRFAGVATVDVELADLFSALPVQPTGYAAIINSTGEFIYHWRTELILRDRLTTLTDYFEATDLQTLLDKIVKEHRGFTRIKRKDTGAIIWVAFMPVEPDGTYYVESRYEDEAMASTEQKALLAIVVELCTLAIVMAVVWWLTGLMASPIQELSRAARRIATGERDVKVPVKSPDEIGTLATTFNQMAEVVALRQDEMQEAVNKRTAELEQSTRQVERQKTELEHKVEELRIARDHAEAANQAKSELLAVATHDLKNPLSAIVGLSEIMMDLKRAESTTQAREDLELLQTINDSATHLSEVVKGILANEGLEAQGVDLNQVVDLGKKCQAVLNLIDSASRRKQITINVEIAPEGELRISGDATRIREAMDNYLSNAIKYSPPGREVTVRLFAQSDGRHARFEVADQGPGLSEADQRKLFGKFQKLSAQPTGGESATGLGLSIVKSIVEMHGGRVGCESRLGAGATFWLELPLLDSRHVPA